MSIFKKRILKGDMFAVHTGTYAGEVLIFIKDVGVDYHFLCVPTMVNRTFPIAVFDHARNTGIIKYIQRAPKFVLQTATAQHTKNEKSSH